MSEDIRLRVGNAIVSAVMTRGGTDEDLESLEGDDESLERIAKIALERRSAVLEPREYFTPLADGDVPEQYRGTLNAYRTLATAYGVSTTAPICYRVTAGFTLTQHAPKAGPCYDQFQYLQGWNFPDESTMDCLVFWVPRLLECSVSKTVIQQRILLAETRERLCLPVSHMRGFGQAALVAGLILAHHKATDERIPLSQHWVRTENCNAVGDRLSLGNFNAAGLDCGWDDSDEAFGNLGVFALGVERTL